MLEEEIYNVTTDPNREIVYFHVRGDHLKETPEGGESAAAALWVPNLRRHPYSEDEPR